MKIIIKLLMVCFVAAALGGCGSDEEKDITERMAEEHEGDTPVQNESVLYEQMQPVDSMEVSYAQTDSGAITGFLAKPQNAEGDLPGIIVIHEWWGLNDNVRMMTKRLAGLGYVALAVDLYNGQVADTPEKAKELMVNAQYQTQATLSNLKKAGYYLKQQQKVDKLGVIGWCFGGGWSLQTALAMPNEIDATVVYYGRLITNEAELRLLDSPLVGFFGEQDEGISPKQVKEFENILINLEKDAEIYVYNDAGHAFANPSGTLFNKEAAQDAWEKTKAFLNENLKD